MLEQEKGLAAMSKLREHEHRNSTQTLNELSEHVALLRASAGSTPRSDWRADAHEDAEGEQVADLLSAALLPDRRAWTALSPHGSGSTSERGSATDGADGDDEALYARTEAKDAKGKDAGLISAIGLGQNEKCPRLNLASLAGRALIQP
jgi:hypothetical protein